MGTLSSLIAILLLIPTFAGVLLTIGLCWPAAWFIRKVLWRFMPEHMQDATEEFLKVILG